MLTDGHTNYIYGPDDVPIEQIGSNGTVSYLHHDQLGSTRLITDSNGSVTGTYSYSPYGQLTGSAGSATSPFGYAAQYTDPLTGLQYDRARFYDPTTAQFLTVDPVQQQTWQAYGYSNGDPISNTDPSGLCSIGRRILSWAADLFADGSETAVDPAALLEEGPEDAGINAAICAEEASTAGEVTAEDGPGLTGDFNESLYESGVQAADCVAGYEAGGGLGDTITRFAVRLQSRIPIWLQDKILDHFDLDSQSGGFAKFGQPNTSSIVKLILRHMGL